MLVVPWLADVVTSGGHFFGPDLPPLHHVRMEIRVVDAHEHNAQNKGIDGQHAQQHHVALADASGVEKFRIERHTNAVFDKANGVEHCVSPTGLTDLLQAIYEIIYIYGYVRDIGKIYSI